MLHSVAHPAREVKHMMRLFQALVALSFGLVLGILAAKARLLIVEGSMSELLVQALALDFQSEFWRTAGAFGALGVSAVALVGLGRMPNAAVSRQPATSSDQLVATRILNTASEGRERADRQHDDGSVEVDGRTSGAELPPVASYVRDYLSESLEELDTGLTVFVDSDGCRGVGYATPLGNIDILAEQRDGDLVVVKIDVNDHPTTACASLLGQTAWVREHLASGREVRGILVTQSISDGLRYVVSETPSIQVSEYELHVKIRDPNPIMAMPSVALPYETAAVATG